MDELEHIIHRTLYNLSLDQSLGQEFERFRLIIMENSNELEDKIDNCSEEINIMDKQLSELVPPINSPFMDILKRNLKSQSKYLRKLKNIFEFDHFFQAYGLHRMISQCSNELEYETFMRLEEINIKDKHVSKLPPSINARFKRMLKIHLEIQSEVINKLKYIFANESISEYPFLPKQLKKHDFYKELDYIGGKKLVGDKLHSCEKIVLPKPSNINDKQTSTSVPPTPDKLELTKQKNPEIKSESLAKYEPSKHSTPGGMQLIENYKWQIDIRNEILMNNLMDNPFINSEYFYGDIQPYKMSLHIYYLDHFSIKLVIWHAEGDLKWPFKESVTINISCSKYSTSQTKKLTIKKPLNNSFECSELFDFPDFIFVFDDLLMIQLIIND